MAPLDEPPVREIAADPIRMSVLNAVLEISNYRETYQGSSLHEAERVLSGGLASSTGHAYSAAVELLAGLPDFRLSAAESRTSAIRSLLQQLTIVRRPAWARLIPRGRRHLAAYLPRNALQCLQAAGLYDAEPDAATLEWWDSLASYFRSASDLERTRIGREGERLTLSRETERLISEGRPDLVPKWVSLDDNSLGYDVLSYRLDGAGRESAMHIEVKASSARPLRFFLTRNEWKVAKSMGDAFVLHVWNLESRTLTTLLLAELEAHLPVDRGRGRWQDVEVTLAADAPTSDPQELASSNKCSNTPGPAVQ
jgi:hypothetical protein